MPPQKKLRTFLPRFLLLAIRSEGEKKVAAKTDCDDAEYVGRYETRRARRRRRQKQDRSVATVLSEVSRRSRRRRGMLTISSSGNYYCLESSFWSRRKEEPRDL
jgi:hypothetical protein